jgi:hypothetical protein
MLRSRVGILPLAARTAQATSTVLREIDANGIIIYLNVTAASGTGGLVVQLRGFNNEGTAVIFYAAPSITTTGNRVYVCSPWNLSAAANGITAVQGVPIPYNFDIVVTHGDASSYTYSVVTEIF